MRFFGSATRLLVGVVLLLGVLAQTSAAQDSVPPPAQPVPAKVPVAPKAPSPWGGFFRSALIPGWGQFSQGRVIPGVLFVAAEVVTVGFAVQANSELKKITDDADPDYDRLVNKREDWLVFVGVNHLLSGVEAFIAAHLWDFPGDLALRPLPSGGTAATLTIPIRFP